ncbi:hypothetical protein LLG46_05780 [bacterium]|nr:hypothetical protein [bacterium]
MAESNGNVFEEIKEAAEALDIVVFPAMPDLDKLRVIAVWPNTCWKSYLDFAVRAKASVLYLCGPSYDPEREIDMAIEQLESMEMNEYRTDRLSDTERAWFRTRLHERLREWDNYAGQTACAMACWFGERVIHKFFAAEHWYDDVDSAITSAIEDAKAVLRNDRRLRSSEESVRQFKFAEQMARHERFTEAKSDARRQFMAQQMFPEEDTLSANDIANKAVLYHWWYVEPSQRVSNVEKCRELYEQGETIRSISAILGMPQTQVKKAIDSTSRTAEG